MIVTGVSSGLAGFGSGCGNGSGLGRGSGVGGEVIWLLVTGSQVPAARCQGFGNEAFLYKTHVRIFWQPGAGGW